MSSTTVKVEFRGPMRDLFKTRDSVVISSAAGCGKTYQTLMWLHLTLLRYPGTKALVVRKVARTLAGTTLTTFREKVAAEALAAGMLHFYGGSPQEPTSFRYTNGSRISIGGLDEPQKIMGAEVSIIVIDEAIETSARDVDMLRTRLRGAAEGAYPAYRIIALTNPGPPTHYLNTSADLRLAHSTHKDNPALWAGGAWTGEGTRYLAELDKLTGVRRARLLEGRWVAVEGVIYEEWDPAVHVIERFPVPATWRRVWSVDFGYTNPTVVQWWAVDPDERAYLYRELYMTRRTVDEHAAAIMDQVTDLDGAWTEPRPEAVVCDHDAGDRAVLERETGITTLPAYKIVQPGIQGVQRRLRMRDDGTRGLYIMKGSLVERDQALAQAAKPTCTEEEFPSYVWDTGAGKQPKESPLKVDDHGVDAGRYTIAYLDGLGKGQPISGFGGW